MYRQLKKNNVESFNQLKENEFVKIYNSNGKGKRILFVGNSITHHDVKEEIGWMNSCGMAASKKENDYVHVVMDKVFSKDADAAYCICHVSKWENQYKNGTDFHSLYSPASDFGADIIIARFVENCPIKNFDPETFKKEYMLLIDYLNKNNKASVVFTSGFWKHPGDGVIREISLDRESPYVNLGDLGENDSMKALGLFEHNGVANHPGDEGMKAIGDRIWDCLCSGNLV